MFWKNLFSTINLDDHAGFGTLLEGGTGYSSLDSHGTQTHTEIYMIYIYIPKDSKVEV